MSAAGARSGSPPTATKRLLHELQQFAQEPNDALPQLGPVSDGQILHWAAVLRGPDASSSLSGSSGYEGGLWKLDIVIPQNYPLAPPDVKFLTPICHPNVNFKTGEICLDLLKDSWTPAYSIERTLNSIRLLLTDPEPESPLNVDIAALYRAGDRLGAEGLVRYYTTEYRWTG